jgi:hypothetical protein
MTGYAGSCIYTYDNQASLYFNGCSFTSCKVILRADLGEYGDCDGGAICAKGNFSLTNSTFNDGEAVWGSCVEIYPYSSNTPTVFVNFSIFSNSHSRKGGAVGQDAQSSNYTSPNCRFLNNTANDVSVYPIEIPFDLALHSLTMTDYL